MKIAILGTRGIPNNYGGPETNAEMMSPIFIALGHEVTVYSPDEHPYQQNSWQGIRIKHIYNQESRLGIWGTLAYDFLCLRDALASDFDIVLELGYVPVAIFYPLFFRRRAKLVTNMDGLEWKRSKWNAVLQRFARLTEVPGARCSDALIADNEAIRDYLRESYGRDSYFIPYGAAAVAGPDPAHLERYGVQAQAYFMLIARLEPENNIEIILDGYLKSGDTRPFLVVGKTTTAYGARLLEKYAAAPRIQFLGGIYDYTVLSSLRWQAAVYFHGHSVGGTNPSLVEAMASSAYIAAHDNPFNRSVLEANAWYFTDTADVARIINADHSIDRADFSARNLDKVRVVYNWEVVAREHLRVFEQVIARR
jgi:glycosyltransferase involved in cell wall biosynthesis